MALTDKQCQDFRRDGYCILPGIIPPEQLAKLRRSADQARERFDRRLDSRGTDRQGLAVRNSRYFIIHPSFDDHVLYRFACSDLMADIVRSLLGDTAFLFWEQFVLKGPAGDSPSRFSWHQDAAYVPFPHPRYLTCWCALDDMSEANGTVRILPFGRGPDRPIDHVHDAATDDLVGDAGGDPGEALCCPAGSIACFTSHNLHCSGDNRSAAWRRVYLLQYSTEVIRPPEEDRPHGRSEALWLAGQRMLAGTPI